MDAPNCFLLSKRLALLIILISLTQIFGKISTSLSGLHRGGGESSTFLSKTTTVSDRDAMPSSGPTEAAAAVGGVAIVFSDLDGTLIHYPDCIDDLILDDEENRRLVQLPPSSTGMVGVISAETLRLCQEVRRKAVKLVLVSGMRTSTLINRLPFLPKADVYCSEGGGRIFFTNEHPTGESIRVDPTPYDGATEEDLKPFFVVEDIEWRSKMERADAAGMDGFLGAELNAESFETPVPVSERGGSLWSHARTLEEKGFVLDTEGYSTCFRINRKQQTDAVNFDALLEGKISCPGELATSTNLGCVDFYPVDSGKRNCCAYLANKFSSGSNARLSLESDCVCLCDDDNDIDMALACSHAYIPHTTSDSMAETVRSNPAKFSLTALDGERDPTQATDRAMTLVLDRILTAAGSR